MNRRFLLYSMLLLGGSTSFFASCTSKKSQHGDFSTDPAAIAAGENIFNQNCIACHTMDQDGIGPALGGITKEVTAEWLKNFIKDPKKVIESGDPRAKKLFERYKSMMPSFAYYKEDEIDGIVAYLNTHDAPAKKLVAAGETQSLEDPIPFGITMSDLVVEMALVTQMPATSQEKPLTRITKFSSRPDTKEFFVLDLRGKLYRLEKGNAEVYMDIAEHMPNFINKPGHATGFGSFAFHPEFSKNGLLYTTHTEAPGSAKPDFFYE